MSEVTLALESQWQGARQVFAPGQHRAYVQDGEPNIGLLVYADAGGNGIAMVCERVEGVWSSAGIAHGRTTLMEHGWKPIRQGFELSDSMREALDSPTVVADDVADAAEAWLAREFRV